MDGCPIRIAIASSVPMALKPVANGQRIVAVRGTTTGTACRQVGAAARSHVMQPISSLSACSRDCFDPRLVVLFSPSVLAAIKCFFVRGKVTRIYTASCSVQVDGTATTTATALLILRRLPRPLRLLQACRLRRRPFAATTTDLSSATAAYYGHNLWCCHCHHDHDDDYYQQ